MASSLAASVYLIVSNGQARISRGAGEAAETGLPKMSQIRGLPLQIMLP